MADRRWVMEDDATPTVKKTRQPRTPADAPPAEPQMEPVMEAAPAPQPPEAVRSDRAPLKPGVRKITLAEARRHHGKA